MSTAPVRNRPGGGRAVLLPSLLAGLLLAGLVGGYALLGGDTPPESVPAPGRLEEATANPSPLSGVWKGNWDDGTQSRLVIEAVQGGTARALYAWGKSASEAPNGGWEQVRAQVYPDGSLGWGHPGRFRFRLAPDGRHLDGEFAWRGGRTAITLERIP